MGVIKVFYDYHDDGIKPFKMVIKFRPGQIQWEKNKLIVPLTAPFQRQMSDQFSDGVLSASILLDDLIVDPEKPNTFGIYLPYIKERYKDYGPVLEDIEQFIIQMSDIEEVMQMDTRKYYDWRE